MFVGLMRAARGATRLVAPHLYAFGGAMATSRWLRAVVDGTFELDASGDRFTVSA
jgi:hypothetical protein